MTPLLRDRRKAWVEIALPIERPCRKIRRKAWVETYFVWLYLHPADRMAVSETMRPFFFCQPISRRTRRSLERLPLVPVNRSTKRQPGRGAKKRAKPRWEPGPVPIRRW